jgi:hypothetical protein
MSAEELPSFSAYGLLCKQENTNEITLYIFKINFLVHGRLYRLVFSQMVKKCPCLVEIPMSQPISLRSITDYPATSIYIFRIADSQNLS